MRTRTMALFATAALAASSAVAADLPAQAKGATVAETLQRAELLAARQSWAGAIAAYREAIAASPNDASLRNRLGICYQRKGDTKAARAAYKKALDLRKDYPEAWNNLGTLDHARRKYKQAIAAYSRALKLNPADAVFHKNLGAAWLARGDVDKALEAWTEAFRLDPATFENDAVGMPVEGVGLARQYYLYAKLLAARGETEKALEYLAKAHAAGFNDFGKVERDRDFVTLVADPRYAAMK
ncbi:MAG TPA: tetratricopeptide repeat protein [Vicinamibacteria bacterium]|nr:tetratricopeptide repeat protein [Vicinamibacteria bacterium]